MKVLFVTPYYKPYFGGIERVVEKLGEHLLKQNDVSEIGVLTSKWIFPNEPRSPRIYRGDLADHEILDGFQIFRLSSFPKTAPPFYQVPLVWFPPLQIKQIIKRFDPDVIQLMGDRWFWGNFWAWLLSDQREVVFSPSFHKLDHGQQSSTLLWITKQLLRPINAFLARRVSWVQVVSAVEQHLIQKVYRVPKEKIRVIPWGTELHHRDGSPNTRVKRGHKRVTILSVGRISRHKGQLWLAKRYAEGKFNVTTRLILVGKIDDVAIRDEIGNIELSGDKTIEFTGEVSEEELMNFYKTADIFALFPEYEAFGLVFLEAMSFGVPVLTHKVGAIEEVLGAGAVLTQPYNKLEVMQKLEELVNNTMYRLDLSDTALRFVEQTYSWEKTAEKFLAQYKAHSQFVRSKDSPLNQTS